MCFHATSRSSRLLSKRWAWSPQGAQGLYACYAHECETGTDESGQVLTLSPPGLEPAALTGSPVQRADH